MLLGIHCDICDYGKDYKAVPPPWSEFHVNEEEPPAIPKTN